MSTTKKFSLKIRDYISTPERKREYNEHHFSEKKNGLFLIETFRKLFNLQSYGHLDQLRVAIYIFQDFWIWQNCHFHQLVIPEGLANIELQAVGFSAR